jgi:signal transduction histidine kinase
MRRRSVSTRIGRWLALLLLCVNVLQIAVALTIIARETATMREVLLGVGLRTARLAARGERLDRVTLRRDFGDFEGFAVALYDVNGIRRAASRDDVRTLARLDPAQMRAASGERDRVVFVEPYALGDDNVGIMFADAEGAAYVGIFDRWATRRLNRAVLLGSVTGCAVAALAGFLAVRLTTRRIQRALSRAESTVQRIAEGSFEERLPASGDDEVARLAVSFNKMTDQLQARMQELRREQEARRRAFADWSHELGTPLSSVLGYLESLDMGNVAEGDRPRYVQTAYQQALALKALSDDLGTIAQLDFDGFALDRSEFELAELVRAEVSALRPQAERRQIRFSLELGEGRVNADRQRLARALRNLLTNALRHTGSGGCIVLESRVSAVALRLVVADDGEGMSDEQLAHAGEPFFRVDVSRNRKTGGRGLGLAITKGIVEAHGGSLHFESTPGAGTRVTVELPLENST